VTGIVRTVWQRTGDLMEFAASLELRVAADCKFGNDPFDQRYTALRMVVQGAELWNPHLARRKTLRKLSGL
jgi:hypothetical protein